MTHLKSIRGEQKRFAVLEEPKGTFYSNEDLYAAVFSAGEAKIKRFVGATLELEEITEVLTPRQFEKEWEGD